MCEKGCPTGPLGTMGVPGENSKLTNKYMKKKLTDYKPEDYCTPTKNNILIRWETNDVQNGIVIPEALREKKLGLEVLAIGNEVHSVAVGDLVVPSPHVSIATFKLFDQEVAQIADHQVFNIISKDYEQDLKDYNSLKEKLEKAKTEIIN